MNFFTDNPNMLYLLLVSVFGILFLFWLHLRITRFKSLRIKRARNLDIEQVGAFPVEDLSRKEIRKQQKALTEGVAQRFTIISRTIYLTLGIIWLFAMTFPFMNGLSGTYVSIVITAVTVVVGIAARPFVENLFSGIVISFSNQLRVGDTLVIDDQYGSVEDISITHTKVKTWESKRYIIPNSRMLTKEFINLTINEMSIWATMEFRVSYDADIDKVTEIAETIGAELSPEDAPEKPFFWVRNMERDSFLCALTVWADTPSTAWTRRSEIAVRLVRAFRQEGIRTNVSNLSMQDGFRD